MTLTENQGKNLLGLAILLAIAGYISIPLLTQDYYREKQEAAERIAVAQRLHLPHASVNAFIEPHSARYSICRIDIAKTEAAKRFSTEFEELEPEEVEKWFAREMTTPFFKKVRQQHFPAAFHPDRIYSTPAGMMYYDSCLGCGISHHTLANN